MRWEIDNPPTVKSVNELDEFYDLPSLGKIGQLYHVPSTSKWYIYLYPKNKDGSIHLQEGVHIASVDSREKGMIVLASLAYQAQF